MSNSPEQLNTNPEATAEQHEAAAEQLEKLANKSEATAELSPRDAEISAETARLEALDSAVSVEAGGKEKKTNEPSFAARRGPISKKQREVSYKRTMKQVQTELSPGSRAFSKTIHNKAVEKTSEVIGATIARPDAILAGAVMAFVLTLAVYVTAKTIGYQLSGFETIAAFVIGWVAGIIYDYFRVLITGKNS